MAAVILLSLTLCHPSLSLSLLRIPLPHNAARAAVGVPPLLWSPNLTAEADRLARRQVNCTLAELSGGAAYGVNQAWASYRATPAEVVALWVSEQAYYNHTANSCSAGHECGTFTQVVWRRSEELGCAQNLCGGADAGPVFTICLYHPPGNFLGQRPY
ncbi:unnamed protein product [Spirodela intermedia]|uniref:SCP domain-containing protein n=1 Tax=Spirodela intermedia TaxID=51605 RepID=A0A7I8IYU1_SPIIN|nr:unnamed protein product [Spirodela intermedia]CAA6663047.1 unnamed protein product [Spirodela intermedia]